MELSVPPQNLEAEQSILGAILHDNKAIYELDSLDHELFYREAHQMIFKAMVDLLKNKEPIDIITLSTIMKDDVNIVGGATYFIHLRNSVTTAKTIKHHYKLVYDKYLLRQILKVSAEVSEQCQNEETAINILSYYQNKINNIANCDNKKDFVIIKDLLDSAVGEIYEYKPKGLNTGFDALDYMISLSPEKLIIMAARPGMGKTSLGLNIGINVAMQDKKVGFLSLEMPSDELIHRIISAESCVDLAKMNKDIAKLSSMVSESVATLSKLNFYIDDSISVNTFDIKAKANRMHHKHGLDLLIIDYLGFIKGVKGDKRIKRDLVSDNVIDIKNLARELKIPIILLCQLNRDVEARDKKEPKLSDLRDSGEIEQTADSVVFIHNENIYSHEANFPVKLIVAKNRGGRTGFIDLYWNRDFTKFTEKKIERIAQ